MTDRLETSGPEPDRRRITIAILALGGQGGGVLADWILATARSNGYVAQGTSVPGVAQRTGSTVYYIEMVPRPDGDNRGLPVLALNPVPGDVDVVIASELMEAGRAILRGFVSKDRTTLVGSTHRIYAISEKSARGDGTASGARIVDAAHRRAARFIGFDMDEAATTSGSMISSVMFGALAGSGALPFSTAAFENAIRAGGKAVPANLRGFAAGIDGARMEAAAPVIEDAPPQPTSPAGRVLAKRILAHLPDATHAFAIEGVRRLMDYQDAAYATLYLDRLDTVHAVDDGQLDWTLTRETARGLALWMAYEDVVRVADLKVRATRSARITQEVGVRADQMLRVTEYMHPRLREVCETLPSPIGRALLGSPRLGRLLAPLFAKGRHVETTGLRWFVVLRAVAGMRRFRRSSLRYAETQAKIEEWLQAIRGAAAHDIELATELARNQRLIKGYGDTFDRGMADFDRAMAAATPAGAQGESAALVRSVRDAALADDSDCAVNVAAGSH